jgi:hypothetical protein
MVFVLGQLSVLFLALALSPSPYLGNRGFLVSDALSRNSLRNMDIQRAGNPLSRIFDISCWSAFD